MGVKITVNDVFFTDSLARSLLLDVFSSPFFAVSAARLLTNKYKGPLMTVRRPSDNLELDVFANNAGLLDETALLDFAGSEDLFVSHLYNQTESGGFFGQSESSPQPQIVESGQVIKTGGLASLRFDAHHFLRAYGFEEGPALRPFAGKTTMAAALIHQYVVAPAIYDRTLFVAEGISQNPTFSLRASSSTKLGYSAKPCSADVAEAVRSVPVSVGELNQITVETHLDTGNIILSKNGNIMESHPIVSAQCSVISSDPSAGAGWLELGHRNHSIGGTFSQLISEVILFNTNTGQDIREIEANQVSTYGL